MMLSHDVVISIESSNRICSTIFVYSSAEYQSLCNRACNLKPGIRAQGHLCAFSCVQHSEFSRQTTNLNYMHVLLKFPESHNPEGFEISLHILTHALREQWAAAVLCPGIIG